MTYIIGLLLIAIIALFVWIVNLYEENNNMLRQIDRINNDHNSISKENIELRELLELQDILLNDEI